jgi:trehalose synthase
MNFWNKLKKFVERYDISIYSLQKYAPKNIDKNFLINHPCIDPLSEKNKNLTNSQRLKTLDRFDIHPDKPIIGQVSRFDKWKNQLGVIDVFRKIKSSIPDVQLLLIGSFSDDDPEGKEWHQKTIDYLGSTPDTYILTDLQDEEVNALQRSFTTALQLSIKEGFSLTVTEALWKGVPVVATRVGGIPLQVIDNVTGYLVNDLEEASLKAKNLITKPWLARQFGKKSVEHVRNNFLITKCLKDYLQMHIELVGQQN